MGGPADFFSEPQNTEELIAIWSMALAEKVEISVLAGGTNILIADSGVRGLVISLKKLTGIEILENSKTLKFWAMSGTPKSELLRLFLKHKLSAALFLAGLPGQVSGGVVMNAGVSEKIIPREFCEIVSGVEVLRPNGKIEFLDASQLNWSYRDCAGWQPGIITRVRFSVLNRPESTVVAEVKKLNQARLHKQPLEYPNGGSVFRNPIPLVAGKLVQDAGLKGYTIGGAQISEKHGNFIVNKGGARARDIRALIDMTISKVQNKFNVSLQTEIIFLGQFG